MPLNKNMKQRVYITRQIPEQAMSRLADSCEVRIWDEDSAVPSHILIQEAAQVEGIFCLLTDRIDSTLLAAANQLKVVSNMAVGYDNIDIPACTARRIPVGNTPGVLTETTADLAWALLMACARRLPEAEQFVKDGKWVTWGPMLMTGLDVYGATLGIIGMGRIGAALARRAGGFSMRVVYSDRQRNETAERETGARFVDLDTLLAESDFISLHTSLNETTHHLIDAQRLSRMKPTTILINTARGSIIEPDALYDALSQRKIWAAGLDVIEPEPLPGDHPLLKLPNCLVVPHIASASIATRTRMAIMAAENLLAGLRGEALPNCVNPQVYRTDLSSPDQGNQT